MRNSGSSRRLRQPSGRSSARKVNRVNAKTKNRKTIISPTPPEAVSLIPPTGEMPEVAMTDIAWVSATSGRSPLT